MTERNKRIRADNMPSPPCIFNHGVGCEPTGRHCATCGWNPGIAELRKQQRKNKTPRPSWKYPAGAGEKIEEGTT